MAQRHDLSQNSSQSASDSTVRSPKQIPAKCVCCALLSMAEVRSLHGAMGDGCYVSEVCRSRRSYARHHDQRNQIRRQKWHETSLGTEGAQAGTQPTAQLIVYRAARYNALIDAIAADVRQGQTKLAVVSPVYCLGLLPRQIDAYIEAMRLVLQQDYGMDKFAGIVQLPRSWQDLKSVKQRSRRYREIEIDLPGVTDSYSAVLQVYRQPETEAVMAIKTEVWRGATPESGTPRLSRSVAISNSCLFGSSTRVTWLALRDSLVCSAGATAT